MEIMDAKGAAELDCAPEASANKKLFPFDGPIEWLRLWEPAQPFVVLGRSSRAGGEVDLAACRQANLPVLRRSSGGAAVVVGPGCLMYSVVLSYEQRPRLRAIDQAHRFVLERHVTALRPSGFQVGTAGTSDIVFGEPPRKFSGNSLRCKRTHLLYHGTLLYNFDLSLIARCLHSPPRQPDYRKDREHASFVANLPVSGTDLRRAIRSVWHAHPRSTSGPGRSADVGDSPISALVRITSDLVGERYGKDPWTFCIR